MKKTITFLSIAFLLSGCMYQTVNRGDIEAGATVCAQRQSTLIEIESHFSGLEVVTCSNRRSYTINADSLTPIVAM